MQYTAFNSTKGSRTTTGIRVKTPFTTGYICFVLPESIIDAGGYSVYSGTKASKV
jgi:hypothetical protein